MTPESPVQENPHAGSTEYYAAFFEHSPDAAIIVDGEGRIVDANRRAVDLFGYSRDDLCSMEVEDLVPTELVGVHRELRGAFSAGPRTRRMGNALDMDLSARRADGTRIAVDIGLSPLPVGDRTLVAATIRDVTEHRNQVEELSQRAYRDEVTGLANRSMVIEVLGQVIRTRPEHLTGIAFLDLDHFKEVNDEFGHAVGDHLLQAVAARLTSATRRQDLVARFGGDEFVVLFETGTADRAQARALVRDAAERLRAACADPFDLDGPGVEVSVSIGVTLVDFVRSSRGNRSVQQILDRADAAQYEAKRAGRNRVICDWDT